MKENTHKTSSRLFQEVLSKNIVALYGLDLWKLLMTTS